jgi:hypothetical protein
MLTHSRPECDMLIRIDQEGSVTLPKPLREGLDENTLLEAVRRADGVIELRPTVIDPSQAWFWTERWQEMEREADEDIAAGRVRRFEGTEGLFAYLDSLQSECTAAPRSSS